VRAPAKRDDHVGAHFQEFKPLYSPAHHRVEDPAELARFMRAHAFAIVVTAPDGVPRATHVPCAVVGEGDRMELLAHLARANPQWRDFDGARTALVIFGGPHAYVSPRHYERAKAVPTWNYAAVHAYGRPRCAETRDEAVAVLEALGRAHDPDYVDRMHAMPGDYMEAMLRGIVAFGMPVDRLEARYKLSQEKQPRERGRIVAELAASSDSAAVETAGLMAAHGRREPPGEYDIVPAWTAADLDAARALFRDYQREIEVDLCFQGFEEELATLPGRYGMPDGRLFLAKRASEVVGCIALRRFDAETGEVKRLYVVPRHRAGKLGEALAGRTLDAAREVGYRRLVLDTLAPMQAARRLYAKLGFREIAPYYDNPLPGTMYMALALAAEG
jgi:transcriptional regulator